MSEFTKGPWVKDRRNEELKGADGYSVVVWGSGLCNGPRSKERVANSYLIAAAPLMYEALLAISKGEGLQPGKTIEGVLLKARGEYNEN